MSQSQLPRDMEPSDLRGVKQPPGGRIGCLAIVCPGLMQVRYKENPTGGAFSESTGALGPKHAGDQDGDCMAHSPVLRSSFLVTFISSTDHGGLNQLLTCWIIDPWILFPSCVLATP